MGISHTKLLSSLGCKVVATDKSSNIHNIYENINSNILSIRHDITNYTYWPHIISETIRAFGPPNVLVNNAGIAPIGTIEDISVESLNTVLSVNCVGMVMAIKALIPSMKSAGGGSIINISSILGLKGSHPIEYCISKFGVTGMTKSAAGELSKYNIRVNSIHPGFAETNMLNNAEKDCPVSLVNLIEKVPMRRIAAPIEISNLVAFLASDESSYCTGSEFIADGGQLSQI